MKPMKVYDIPPTLWHNTVTQKDTKMIFAEDSATGAANSNVLDLTPEQIARVKELVEQ